ncbi:hypothetical protein HDU98_007053, partial [Podochytrium sp. JEL0797]
MVVAHDIFPEEPLPKYSLGGEDAVLSNPDFITPSTVVSSGGYIIFRDMEEV